MKNLSTILRIILGVIIAFSGLNKFGHWLDAEYMHDAMQFVVKLSNIGGGFIIKTIAVLEILIGISLITNKFSTLAVIVLLPLMVSIVIFHLFLDLKGIAVAAVVLILTVYQLYERREKLSGLFKA